MVPELPKIPENLSPAKLREIYNLTQDQIELVLKWVLTQYSDQKKEREDLVSAAVFYWLCKRKIHEKTE